MGTGDPTEAYFKDGLWGWVATRWRKLQLLWGYSDVYSERETEASTSAEEYLLEFSTVPAGEVWVVHLVSAFSTSATPDSIEFLAVVGGVETYLKTVEYPFALLTVDWIGHLILKEGDMLAVAFKDCGDGDDIEAYATGYKMKIAE